VKTFSTRGEKSSGKKGASRGKGRVLKGKLKTVISLKGERTFEGGVFLRTKRVPVREGGHPPKKSIERERS